MAVFADLEALDHRHYIRRPSQNTAHILQGKVQKLVTQYGDDFCLLIQSQSGNWYVVPYASIKKYLTSATLKQYKDRRCWRVAVDEAKHVVKVDGTDAQIPLQEL